MSLLKRGLKVSQKCGNETSGSVSGRWWGVWITAAALLMLSASAVCGGPNGNAKILVHLVRCPCDLRCTTRVPPCAAVNVAGALYPPMMYWAGLLVVDGDPAAGVAGAECGIDYEAGIFDGVFVLGWTLCADREFPVTGPNGPWPAAGAGNRLEWNGVLNCQRTPPDFGVPTVATLAGYFYVGAYTSDNLSVIANPGSGVATVTSCNAVVDTVHGGGIVRNPPHVGYARFSPNAAEPGYDPCGLATAVEGSTWSRLKSLLQ